MKNMKSLGSSWSVSAIAVFILAGGLTLFLPAPPAMAATLTHRWTFDTNANDVIGGANGTLVGAAYLTNGGAVFDGANSGVQLPNDLFTNYDSISFEVWLVDQAAQSSDAGVYFFRGANGTMNYDVTGTGYYYSNSVQQSVYIPLPTPGRTNHLVWTQDTNSHTACIYVNGVLAGQNTNFAYTPALIGSTTNWIGVLRSPPNYDIAKVFRGSILEFRVYQDALSPLDVALLDAAGPDQPQINPGDLQDVRLVVPSAVGPGASLKPGVFADFANLTNVNILGQPDLVLSSDDTNVAGVLCDTQQCYMSTANRSTAPLLRPRQKLVTVGQGTASITAVYRGFSNTVPLSVAALQDFALIHRYGFNEGTIEGIAHDSVGVAHARFFGFTPGTHDSRFTGSGQIVLASGAYLDLPEGIISCLSEISIETWVNGGSVSPWQRVFDFGDQFSTYPASGKSYFFLTPRSGNYYPPYNVVRTTISTNGSTEVPRLNWTNSLPSNKTSHVAVAYSPVRGIMKLYINGVPVDTGTAVYPLASINDVNNWLGRSQFGDPLLGASLYEFRIYSGLLSDADVAANYAAGPDAVGVDFRLHTYLSDTNLTITWGPSAPGMTLESSPALGTGAVWTPVLATPVLQNGRLSVTLPMSDAAAYFRLHAL